MADALLAGVRVIDLSGEPAWLTGRILADLGAEVLKDEALLAAADIVITTPGFPGSADADPASAPQSVWVSVTPFGSSGPRAGWRGSDLGAMAASTNLYCSGEPDRSPVRPTAPAAYAHVGPEAAMAALTGLASGRPQHVDVSMQETIMSACMCAPAGFPTTGFRGRRTGAVTGRTREIWPCRDGFVSFGLRGGKARAYNFETLTRLVDEAGLATPALTERDWMRFNQNVLTDDELRELSEPIAAYFAERTMAELYEIACATKLMLAPANSPRELYASAQLAARDFFDADGAPKRFAVIRRGPSSPNLRADRVPRARDPHAGSEEGGAGRAWEGTRILEFGSGAAGPIATRYFAEHGATVIKVESGTRPDFLRVNASLDPTNEHGYEGSPLFAGLNAGKLGVTLNLKHPEGVAIAKRLIGWADAVAENFAPKAMRGLGLDYDSLVVDKPDLVMISACLNGQTGPHRDYPGFGGQGSALAGYNFLTGWPDREPLGPFGTITDSLAPRFVATALAAGLLHHRRTGQGVYIDVSQVEAAIYTLSPWLLEYRRTGTVGGRLGSRSRHLAPDSVFPCAGDDRWVGITVRDDAEWEQLAKLIELDDAVLAGAGTAERRARVDEVEQAVAAWTAARTREEVAETLQAAGIEAVPVADFGDAHDDPQLAHRGHFVPLDHPVSGPGLHERSGFRLSDGDGGYDRPAPTLGQHNVEVLGGILGIDATEQERLMDEGVLA